MNKLMFAAVAALACTASFAETEIVGDNIVGYTSATLAQGDSKTFAVTLSPIGAENVGIKIDNLFKADGLKEGGNWAVCDQIWVWDTKVNKWVMYGYYKKARTQDTPAWKRYNYQLATPTFTDLTDDDVVMPGETFLYNHNAESDLTLTLSGQVKEFTAQPSYTFAQGDSQYIAYPWPVEIKLSDLPTLATWTNLKEGGNWAVCDQIWLWDTNVNKWAMYGYYKKARTQDTPAWKRYNYQLATPTFTDLTDDDKIAVGEGFLYNHNAEGELTITFKPLASEE